MNYKCGSMKKKNINRDNRDNRDVTKHVFLNGEGLQTLILGIFSTKMLHKQCKSKIRVVWLEKLFILLAI